MKLDINIILSKALNLGFLSVDELIFIYNNASLGELMSCANSIREKLTQPSIVSWIVDRNINISNRCFCGCKFCNFHVKPNDKSFFVTSLEEYKQKIDVLFKLGGNQILLQGGLDPYVDINFYTNLFRELKKLYPSLIIHALGPAEIHFIAKKSNLTISETLEMLVDAGLDSLPGAGAEILVDRVRQIVSPNKCSSDEWLNIMRVAHQMNLLTSATMMFGHVETIAERMEHLIKIRDLQAERPEGAHGFKAFIAWPLQKIGTTLEKEYPNIKRTSATEYIKMIAISRIALVNVQNIQASWLTVGKEIAQVCLYAGANDLGSIMIEENVVSSAGSNISMNQSQLINTIIEAGFKPLKRNQDYSQYTE